MNKMVCKFIKNVSTDKSLQWRRKLLYFSRCKYVQASKEYKGAYQNVYKCGINSIDVYETIRLINICQKNNKLVTDGIVGKITWQYSPL